MTYSKSKIERAAGHGIPSWQKQALLLIIYDVFTIIAAYFLALYFRFDGFSEIPQEYMRVYTHVILFYSGIAILIYAGMHLYNCLWRFASYREMYHCILGVVISLVINYAGTVIMDQVAGHSQMPRSFFIFGGIFQFFFLTVSRFSVRFIRLILARSAQRKEFSSIAPAMLIGGGSSGQIILRDLTTSNMSKVKIRCIIDDDPSKWNCRIDDIPVVGGRDKIIESVQRFGIQKIFLAIPRASAEDKKAILNICQETGCQMKILPGIFQFANDEVSLAKMRDVEVEDLLGRKPISVNNEDIFTHISGKVVLVTGGGGSIGSELCRQIAAHSPKQLVIFDVYENNAYDIEQELRRTLPDLNLVVLIGSVRDTQRINSVFETYHPDFVFHAAAHKHVPLMEHSPCEAIKNNVLGTYKTACAAMTHGCKRFLLISTDKAVNPTNIMGASKRLCEMVIQSMNTISQTGEWEKLPDIQKHLGIAPEPIMTATRNPSLPRTEFVAVRFGNVLGSNGSVIPLFKKQLAAGGPITVTHPDIIRYFMTIPEAVSLVLQAGIYAKGGEIFVLDMGEPVKIVDLARNLIKLSGYRPDEDIKIEFTGLRPGEKLYEEKLMAEEGLERTPNELIHIAKPIAFDMDVFLKQLTDLAADAYANKDNICQHVEKIVTTYHPQK